MVANVIMLVLAYFSKNWSYYDEISHIELDSDYNKQHFDQNSNF